MSNRRRKTSEHKERLHSEAELERQKLRATEEGLAETSRLYRELQNREAKIHCLVEANVVGIVMWILEGAITGANDAFLRMVQYDREDLAAGRVRWADLTSAEWRDRDERAIAELKARGVFQPYEKEYLRKDGSSVPIVLGGAFFEDSGNEGVAFILDLSEQKRAEETLRRSEGYLAESQRLAKTGIWAYDPTTKKALYWSDEMFRIHGLDPELGPPSTEAFLEHVHPEDRDSVREAMLNAVREKTEYEIEHRMILPNGTIKHIHALGHPVLNRSGDVVEVVGSAVDVTERKRFRELEADLAHMNRVSMMGHLEAALAHEIKQPIAAAITDATTGLRWLARDVPDLDEARQAIVRSVKDSTRAAEIVNRLRSFSRKGAPPKLEMVDLNEVVGEMLMLLRDEVIGYRITMHTELAPKLPTVMIDRVQLQQVFMNLMLNAIEAMKETAGELTIKSKLSDNGQLRFRQRHWYRPACRKTRTNI
jgi:PAS domain S-box-containing protein